MPSVPSPASTNALCVHAHFYQPPREDPFTGEIPEEYGAGPYHDFNAKITAECYRPNAELGNLERLSFDLGPTLAGWLEHAAPDVYAAFLAADRQRVERDGAGNAMAQAYNHTILPLASPRDQRTQVAWGIADFRHRFGRAPRGMWLAETAVDLGTLEVVARQGIAFVILAPWQAEGADPAHASGVDTTRPYQVALPEGRAISVFFYDANLAGAAHGAGPLTDDPRAFARYALPMRLDNWWWGPRGDQLLLAASDGEFYGHHRPGRERWLATLLGEAAPAAGFSVTWPERWLLDHPAVEPMRIRSRTSWSCRHGLVRWMDDCDCVRDAAGGGDGFWKLPLRTALDRLADRLDHAYARFGGALLRDPWDARDASILVRLGEQSWETFFATWASDEVDALAPLHRARAAERARDLLDAQYYRQLMYTSCGFFFEDLDRIEPRNNLAYAAMAIRLTERATPGFGDFEDDFLADLEGARGRRSGRTAAQLYDAIRARASR
ncbi:MAG TPA: DUF3536 domain-containing protein [Ktedonobacterales bacterium]|jgi:hypothetical protein